MVRDRFFVVKLHDGGRFFDVLWLSCTPNGWLLWQSCDPWGVLVQFPSILMILQGKMCQKVCRSCA